MAAHMQIPDTRSTTDESGRPAGWFRRHPFVGRYLELQALWGITVSQPILDTLAGSPETLVYRRATGTDVVVFALAVTITVPLLAAGAQLAVHRWAPRASRWLHLVSTAMLAALAGWQLVERHTQAPVAAHLTVGLLTAVVGTWLLARTAEARTVLRFVAVVPLGVAALWVATGPVHRVAFAEGPDTSAGLPVTDPAPVVMVVLDELPTASLLGADGRIDASLFPAFAELAEGATWYRNTTSVSPTTPEAVPAILTGRYPSSLGALPTSSSHPDNLFSALRGSYELNVWELVTQLCPPEQCPARGGATQQGLGALMADAAKVWVDYVDRPPPRKAEAFAIRQSDPEAPATFERFIASLGNGDKPSLDFLHVPLPHQPWKHLPSGARHDGPFLAEGLDGSDRYSWESDHLAEAGRLRHLLQVQRTDELLGRLLRRLRDLDRYDESLIVVTSDHGAAFTEGEPIRGLADANAEEILWVPLLVKEPGQLSGRIDDRPMETVDILPTLASILGVDLPWEIDGRDSREPRPETVDLRRFYPWKYNVLLPPPGSDHVEVDGEAGFSALLERPPVGSAPRDDFQLFRFGRWGHLVGRPAADLVVASAAGPGADPDAGGSAGGTGGYGRAGGVGSDGGVVLTDNDDEPVAADHFDMSLGDDVVPVYIQGTIDAPLPADVAVTVNGVIAGWCEVFSEGDDQRFFVLAPQQLLGPGPNEIEVFTVTGEPAAPRLTPQPVMWNQK